MANEFYVKKEGDKIILTIVSKSETSIELDIEDAADMALDIQQYIQQYINQNSNDAYNEKAKMQAKAQNDSKNKSTADMSKWINNHFGSKYDLDPIERAVKERDIEKLFGDVYTIDLINNTATNKKK
jgi:hypothetical protein